ncbi:MAG: response regulator [Acidobacteriota bacterium]
MSTTSFPTIPVEKAPHFTPTHRKQDVWPLVFVVDDEPVITETLKAILNRSGIATLCANSGVDALELAAAVPPDLLITDYRMPGMNGIELATSIKQLAPHCEIILFSGNLTFDKLAAEAANSGVEMVTLAKPVHPARILELVKARLPAA